MLSWGCTGSYCPSILVLVDLWSCFYVRKSTGVSRILFVTRLAPKNNSHLYFSPSLRLHDLLFFIAMILLVPRRRMRCRVPAQVTAFHASPCKYLGFIFPKLIGTFPSQPTPGRASVEVLKSFHFLVMVSFLFYFSCFSPRAGMHHISISGMAGTLSDIRLLCWVVL